MSCEQQRVIFLLAPSKAYGEINIAIPLAKSIANSGGEVWFLGSPLAARVTTAQFPGRSFEMSSNREANQVTFWRMVRKYRANMVVFSELYEVLQPRRKTDCPLMDAQFFESIENLDATLVFMDFISHVPALQEIASRGGWARRFGGRHLRSFLQRLWVILPCPLNEPAFVPGRRGVPYRTQTLPIRLLPEDRAGVRKSLFAAKDREKGVLIVRTGSTWQAKLAEEYGVGVYDHFTELLASYLHRVQRAVTVVSVSDKQRLRPDRSKKMRIVNLSNLAPDEYQRLILSADLVLTDNQIGYTLATIIGNVPGVVLVNSYDHEQIMLRERRGSVLWRLIHHMEQQNPGSIYPHQIFPLPEEPWWADEGSIGNGNGASSSFGSEVVRLGRMLSSPYVKGEMYGGQETAELFHWLLEDPSAKEDLRQQDAAYIERLNAIEDGATVLERMFHSDRLVGHTAC